MIVVSSIGSSKLICSLDSSHHHLSLLLFGRSHVLPHTNDTDATFLLPKNSIEMSAVFFQNQVIVYDCEANFATTEVRHFCGCQSIFECVHVNSSSNKLLSKVRFLHLLVVSDFSKTR